MALAPKVVRRAPLKGAALDAPIRVVKPRSKPVDWEHGKREPSSGIAPKLKRKIMPEKKPIEGEREGKAPSTQAGEFVREEIELIREGAHGARSTKQAIAIGLSKARP
jgi:hypothetical protein